MSWEKAKWFVAALAAAALGAVILAACGGSSNGSDQFRGKTNSGLLDFGEESSGAEMEGAEKAVREFFLARSKEDWPATCTQLSQALLSKIEHLAVSSTQLEDKSCPSFLEAFLSISEQERRESTAIDAGSLRQRGSKAFLIYYGERENIYAMPLRKEGSAWRVDSLAPKQLS
ncbi:MAG TPA: hypothetical protein VKH20_05585 [Solirubrobacterales bacterium]|nr:hypothetical protein [Solirubrobacterales bacterium]